MEREAFRADLYYRLNVATIDLPPLQERREDVPGLFAHFVRDASVRYERAEPVWTASDMARWQAYDWPGNVRELKNVAERFSLGLDDGLPQPAPDAGSLEARMARAERACIEEALRNAEGQVMRAAELLDLPRKTLYDKISRHGIDVNAFRTRTQ